MNSNQGALNATLRVLVSLGLLVGGTDAALAATSGSTDIYCSGDFSSSFGSGTLDLGTSAQSAETSGSTDIYANEFERSFGPAGTVRHQVSNMKWNGSTDLWGNGFREIVDGPGSSVGSTPSAKSAVQG